MTGTAEDVTGERVGARPKGTRYRIISRVRAVRNRTYDTQIEFPSDIAEVPVIVKSMSY